MFARIKRLIARWWLRNVAAPDPSGCMAALEFRNGIQALFLAYGSEKWIAKAYAYELMLGYVRANESQRLAASAELRRDLERHNDAHLAPQID